jgi:hypothetical protein
VDLSEAGGLAEGGVLGVISDAYLTKVGLEASKEGGYLEATSKLKLPPAICLRRVCLCQVACLCGSTTKDGRASIDSAFRRACREGRVKEQAGTSSQEARPLLGCR